LGVKVPGAAATAATVVTNLWTCIPPAASFEGPAAGKFYQIIDGKVDAQTFNGFRRYHAGCNHCHGQDGAGSTFAPSLVVMPAGIDAFRRVVKEGRTNGSSVMKGFGDDPNIAPYIDDIYAYLQARADGMLGPGRPARLEN
jgi:mono/diheme cytochrome c family protein